MCIHIANGETDKYERQSPFAHSDGGDRQQKCQLLIWRVIIL